LQCNMPSAQFLRLSTRLAIPELYKGANSFATRPHIHFDHQTPSSLLEIDREEMESEEDQTKHKDTKI
jgi:hypothetical protein